MAIIKAGLFFQVIDKARKFAIVGPRKRLCATGIGGASMRASIGLVAFVIAQPAVAQEIVIECTGQSKMTIYNPHGNGGEIGDVNPRRWTVRTNGQSGTVTYHGEKTETLETEMELTSSGLSFCNRTDGFPCDQVQKKPGSRGGTTSNKISRTTIDDRGYRRTWAIMEDNVSPVTGVMFEDTGQCDQAGLAALRQFAEGGSSATPDSTSDSRETSVEQPSEEAEYQKKVQQWEQELADRQKAVEEYEAEKKRVEEQKAAQAAKAKAAEAEYERQRQEHEAEVARIAAETERRRKEYEAELEKERKAEAALVDFPEAVVVCELNQNNPQAKFGNWRCVGPLQFDYAKLGPDGNMVSQQALYNISNACGGKAERVRDFGRVSGYRVFGCSFGIKAGATGAVSKDAAAQFGLGYIPGRMTFRCDSSRSTCSNQ